MRRHVARIQGMCEKQGMKPRAKIIAMANMGDDPTLMLNAPDPAAMKVLAKPGLTKNDIDIFEIQVACDVGGGQFIRELGLDRSKFKPDGGSVALGHPTDAIRIGNALVEPERIDRRAKRVTMHFAGGMAPATNIESF
jgi:acetyl-CoA C-acetyltransferase